MCFVLKKNYHVASKKFSTKFFPKKNITFKEFIAPKKVRY